MISLLSVQNTASIKSSPRFGSIVITGVEKRRARRLLQQMAANPNNIQVLLKRSKPDYPAPQEPRDWVQRVEGKVFIEGEASGDVCDYLARRMPSPQGDKILIQVNSGNLRLQVEEKPSEQKPGDKEYTIAVSRPGAFVYQAVPLKGIKLETPLFQALRKLLPDSWRQPHKHSGRSEKPAPKTQD